MAVSMPMRRRRGSSGRGTEPDRARRPGAAEGRGLALEAAAPRRMLGINERPPAERMRRTSIRARSNRARDTRRKKQRAACQSGEYPEPVGAGEVTT